MTNSKKNPVVVTSQTNVVKNIDLKITQSDMLDIMIQDAIEEYNTQLTKLEAEMTQDVKDFIKWYRKNWLKLSTINLEDQVKPSKEELKAAQVLGIGKYTGLDVRSVLNIEGNERQSFGLYITSPQKDEGNYAVVSYSQKFFEAPITFDNKSHETVDGKSDYSIAVAIQNNPRLDIPMAYEFTWERDRNRRVYAGGNPKVHQNNYHNETGLYFIIDTLVGKKLDKDGKLAVKLIKERLGITPAQLKKLIKERMNIAESMQTKLKQHHSIRAQRIDLERRPGKYKAKFTKAALAGTAEGNEILEMITAAKEASRGRLLEAAVAAEENTI